MDEIDLKAVRERLKAAAEITKGKRPFKQIRGTVAFVFREKAALGIAVALSVLYCGMHVITNFVMPPRRINVQEEGDPAYVPRRRVTLFQEEPAVLIDDQ